MRRLSLLVLFFAVGALTAPAAAEASITYSGMGSGFDRMDMYLTWRDYSPDSGVFPATQFSFEAASYTPGLAAGAYIGLQNVGPTRKTAIFSVWDKGANSGEAQPARANCVRFSGEGTGTHCDIPYPWITGNEYRLRVERTASDPTGDTWTGTVLDTSTGASYTIGSVHVANSDSTPFLHGYGNLGSFVVTWTENFAAGATGGCNGPHTGVAWRGPYEYRPGSSDPVTPTSINPAYYCSNENVTTAGCPVTIADTGGSTVRSVPAGTDGFKQIGCANSPSAAFTTTGLLVRDSPLDDNLRISEFPGTDWIAIEDRSAALTVPDGICGYAWSLTGFMYYQLICGSVPIVSDIDVNAGLGNDIVADSVPLPASFYGGPGNDTLYAPAADTLLDGGTGADHLVGWSGNDTLRGDEGPDTFDGGGGVDTADYSRDSGLELYPYYRYLYQFLYHQLPPQTGATVSLDDQPNDGYPGIEGDNVLSNVENVIGTPEDDTLTGDGAANVLAGGDGNDTLQGGLGNDALDGGAGSDTVSYADHQTPVNVNLGVQKASGANGEVDLMTSFGSIKGGHDNDILIGPVSGTDNPSTIDGNDGNDMLIAAFGGSTLRGRGGDDILDGGPGNDTLGGGTGSDTFAAGGADDQLDSRDGAADTSISCGDGTDILQADPVDAPVIGPDCEHVDAGPRSTASVVGSRVVYVAGAGQPNDLTVSYTKVGSTDRAAVISDLTNPIDAGPGCVNSSASRVSCLAATSLLSINTFDNSDLVHVSSGSTEPIYIQAGLGNDYVDLLPGTKTEVQGGDGTDAVFTLGMRSVAISLDDVANDASTPITMASETMAATSTPT